jgi:hypothetical protein
MSVKKSTAVALIFLIAATTSLAQRRAGANGAAFLKVGVGARAVGLGSAVTTIGGDVEQMFWNPAGTALKDQRIQAAFSYNNWLAGIKQNVGSVAYNWQGIGTIGVGFISFGVSDIPANRDPFNDPSTASTYDYMDMAGQITFSRYVTDKLALGITGKYIREKIDDQTAWAIAFDVGSLYDIGWMGWKVGARLSNIGSDLKFNDPSGLVRYTYSSLIPITFSMGTSITPLVSESQVGRVAVDVVKQQDYLPYFNIGMEYTVEDLLSLRAGYKLNYSDVEDPGRTNRNPIQTSIEGWSVGGGVHTLWQDYEVRIDYAFTDMKIVKDVHRFSIRFGWK